MTMHLTLKEPYRVIKLSEGAEPNVIEIDFKGKPMKVYLNKFDFAFLLIGSVLRDKGIDDKTLEELQTLIEDYGFEMREEGLFSCYGMD
jgi:hypothetical protein